MLSLGLTKDQNLFRWTVVREQDQRLMIERLETTGSLPLDVLSIEKLIIVTGLEGSDVLRRDLILPLTSERILRHALPFQLEPLLPFPLQEGIVFPQYDSNGKETHITVWAATKGDLQSHLAEWQSEGVDPDQVSIKTLALARWARFFFPHQPQLAFIYKDLAIALDKGRIVCAMHSPDVSRLKLFLKQKYPLFEQIDQGPAQHEWSSEKLWDFAIEIGLALEPFEKNSCQLRTPTFTPNRRRKREQFLLKTALAAGIAAILVIIGGGNAIFHLQKKKLKDQITLYHPHARGSLEEMVSELRQRVLQQAKTIPAVPTVPTAQEVLSWLSSLQTSVDIHHIEYELIDYPKEKGKNLPYRAKVTLEFQAKSSDEADRLTKQLQQSPSFVESTHELKWTSYPQGYRLSFPLQKSS